MRYWGEQILLMLVDGMVSHSDEFIVMSHMLVDGMVGVEKATTTRPHRE